MAEKHFPATKASRVLELKTAWLCNQGMQQDVESSQSYA